jgi:hypothetical protein
LNLEAEILDRPRQHQFPHSVEIVRVDGASLHDQVMWETEKDGAVVVHAH